MNFTANAISNNINMLRWKLDASAAVKHFIIERSESGSEFFEIGVKSSSSTIANIDFEFADENASLPLLYYRIKSVMVNGSFEYSEVESVSKENRRGDLAVYPNPVTNHKIQFQNNHLKGNILLQLTTVLGQLVFSKEINLSDALPNMELVLPETIQSGTYFINILDKDQLLKTIKVIIN
jgi:hypothetical protein